VFRTSEKIAKSPSDIIVVTPLYTRLFAESNDWFCLSCFKHSC